jgi:hypothetical protein
MCRIAASLSERLHSVYYLVQDVALKAILANTRTDHRPKLSALKVMIAVCLVVLMLLALVHVADAHSATNAADHCPLCIVMHTVTPFVIMAVVMVLVRIGTQAPEFSEARAIIRYWHPNLFTRPPPAYC